MHPLIFGGSHLAFPALVAAAKSIPAAHLARFGLLRGPFVGLGPVLGAFVGGAVTVALLVPGSRGWLKAQAASAMNLLKQHSEEAPEKNGSSGRARRARNAEPVSDLGE